MAKPNQSPFSPLSTNGAEIDAVFGKFRAGISKGRATAKKIQKDRTTASNRQEDYERQVGLAELGHTHRKAEAEHAATVATNLSAVHGQQFSSFKHDKTAVGFLPNNPVVAPTDSTSRVSETQVGSASQGPKPKRVNKAKLTKEMSTPASPTSTPVASNVASPFTSPA